MSVRGVACMKKRDEVIATPATACTEAVSVISALLTRLADPCESGHHC